MIEFRNLSKTYVTRGQRTLVADDISIKLPARKSIALLGHNGAGKSSLLRMIAGTMAPDSGQVITQGSVSWPVGFAGSFHGDLSGAQNTRFIARIYGVDTDDLVETVQDFAELGPHFHLPVKTYSTGMKARLAFGVSMGIPFDTYLVDEVTSVGDVAFRTKSTRVFQDRMDQCGAIVVSHGLEMIQSICEHAMVLHQGKLHYFTNVGDAILKHREFMRA